VREEGGADVRLHPPALFLGAVLLGIALHWLWALEFASGSRLRIALGVALLCGGVALLGSALRLFHRIGQHPDPRKPTPAIARDGPYRFSRNPMYLGGSLIQLGLGVALGNAWVVLLLLPVFALIHHRVILPEEAYLEEKFGGEYARFKASVRRWI
jgi:protein-S-isoprenylcysteine O-methyltransferase Ste14